MEEQHSIVYRWKYVKNSNSTSIHVDGYATGLEFMGDKDDLENPPIRSIFNN